MRSKSVANPPDDNGLQLTPDRDLLLRQQYPLRRQSAITDIKAKVSKWTKVKAAFKWERANPSLNENGKSTDSGIGLSPINNEVARYLRVPSSPIGGGGGGGAGSSADSVLSFSSGGHLLSGGSSNPATPGTLSSASSMDDVRPVSEDFREFGTYIYITLLSPFVIFPAQNLFMSNFSIDNPYLFKYLCLDFKYNKIGKYNIHHDIIVGLSSLIIK